MVKGIFTPQERFDYAVKPVFEHEGLFSNNPADPGGATNYGISLRFLKNHGIDINDDGQIDLMDVKSLTPQKAKAIYKKYWWDKYHYEAINSLAIATKILDMAVNMGAEQATKLVQRAANYCGHNLVVDGILGAKTLAAINEISQHNREQDFMDEIIDEQKWFYEHLAEEKPALKVFLKGWLRRASFKAA